MLKPEAMNEPHHQLSIHQLEGYIQSIYLVEYDHGILLLDGCTRNDVDTVVDFIENKLNRGIEDLKLVICTHAHPDHFGGAYFFRKRFNTPIAAPEEINQWYAGLSGLLTYCTDILLTYLVARKKKKSFVNLLFPRKLKLNYTLGDQDPIPEFNDWIALNCPGHTGIDLTIFNPRGKIAYIADNFVGSQKQVYRPYPINFPDLYRKSLRRYIDLEINEFLLAHHGKVKVSKDQIQHLIDTAPTSPRRHLTTLPRILLRLIKFVR